jgi:hypothetical protein
LLEQDPRRAGEKIDYALIGRLSIAYIMTMVAAVMRARNSDYMDLLIVATVFNANGEEKRGVSRNAISRMLNVPLETVRRRVNALIQRKTLVEQHDGLVFGYIEDPGPRQYPAIDELNLQHLRQLFRALKANGVEFD